MREWWANVYPYAPEHRRDGVRHETPEQAAKALIGRRHDSDPEEHPAFRVHVRLKPEGAPRRYASEANRRAWEEYPRVCLDMVKRGHSAQTPVIAD